MAFRATTCVLLLALSIAPICTAEGNFPEIFGWSTLDFEFPSDSARQSALRSGYFVPGNSQPIDVQAVGDRVFITMPRWKEGIPATLASVPRSPPGCTEGTTCSPLLNPYPNWSWNSGDKSCDGLTSVFRVNVDKCGRLWVIDSGAVSILSAEGRKTLCPPQLLSFDLTTNRLIRRYRFPKTALKEGTLLVTVALDSVSTADNCLNTYAYLADVTSYGLVVTDTKRGNSWRVENKLFYPYPTWGTFNINGGTFDLMDGVLSLALHPELNPQNRRLYFHAMASARENYVPTSVLRNSSQANSRPREFVMSSGEKPSQSAASAFDSRGVLFFGLLGSNSLACYNPNKPHNPSNIHTVARNDLTMQFASGIKVDEDDRVWMMASRFSAYFLGTLNNNDVNFRVLAAPSRDLTRGTPCDEGIRDSAGGYNPIRFGN
ncbi:protein yellow-like [Hetaerina americana]|uniref:protein yellow-like n=1 Tax=Hetaerina americana TaxID=62018 RepID=UPI003A7F11E5